MAKRCVEILKVCQDAEAVLDYGFNWTKQFARKWQLDFAFDEGVVIRPAGDQTGFEYASSGGQSAQEEPNWPRVVGATVKDGSITWTAQVISNDSVLESINGDSWTTSDPAGLTVTPVGPTVAGGLQLTKVVLSGGTVGQTYTIENEVLTTQGNEYIGRIIIEIE